MGQGSCPASARELLSVLREFAAGQKTSAGLEVDAVECRAELVALAKSLAVVSAAVTAAMVRFDRLGAGSPAALLVQEGHLTRAEAYNLRRLGHRLDDALPATRKALSEGRIGVAQAKTIARLDTRLAESEQPVPDEKRRAAEAQLACEAASATTTETARAAEITRYRLDPETVEEEMRRQRDERGITIAPAPDGTRHIHGLLDPVSGSIWSGFFDRTAAPASPDDTRTAAARRLDALTDAIELQLGAPPAGGRGRITATPDDQERHESGDQPASDPDLGLQESCEQPATPVGLGSVDLGRQDSRHTRPAGRPYQRPSFRQTGEDPMDGEPGQGCAWRKSSPAHVMIIASHDLLTGRPGAEPATFADGTVIPAETARRYVCEAKLNRVFLGTENEPLQLGRTKRLFTPRQVRAMIVRDRFCRWKGCDVPAIRCVPHHAISWSQGGKSDVENGLMLCPTHHRMTHEDHPPAAAGPPEQSWPHAA